jgi:hypothetical protein
MLGLQEVKQEMHHDVLFETKILGKLTATFLEV